MEIIQQIGSYAGLAAFVGLAVLAALYFSQARDVRRLRESQGDPQPSQPPSAQLAQRHAAQQRQGGGKAGAAGAAGAAAAAQPTQARPPQAPAGAASEAAPATPSTPVASGDVAPAGNGGRAAGGLPRLPTRPPMPPQTRRAASSSTHSEPWYRRIAPRYLALIAAGIVVLGAGGAFAVALIAGAGDEAASQQADAGDSPPALDPSTITVAVLNGTTQPGLAEQVATVVEDAGFQRGNVANFTDQGENGESSVLFAEGAERAARQVGQALDISEVRPAGQDGTALAGNADVIVVVGEDRTQPG